MTTTTNKVQPAMRDAFQYTPGDGKRYSWSKGQKWITVERFVYLGTELVFEVTGDRIDAPVSNTAAALMDAVDTWRFQ
jgi:hypothetical protein